jgi:hypothetical protein
MIATTGRAIDTLTRQDIENLKQCGISAEIIERAGIRRVDHREGCEMFGRSLTSGPMPGLLIPNILPGESRPRRDKPEIREKNGKRKEEGKYIGEPGKNHFYIPPGTPAEWLSDRSIPVCFTEGAKKALALLAFFEAIGWKVLVVALPGVRNWSGRIGKEDAPDGGSRDVKGPNPDLDLMKFEGRKVFFCFDANLATNDDVKFARIAFAKELNGRGADVWYVNIPPSEGINGIDDFFGKFGLDSTRQLFDLAVKARVLSWRDKETAAQEAKEAIRETIDRAIQEHNIALIYDLETLIWFGLLSKADLAIEKNRLKNFFKKDFNSTDFRLAMAEAAQRANRREGSPQTKSPHLSESELRQWIQKFIPDAIFEDMGAGGLRWSFDCVWNPEHKGSGYIRLRRDGKIEAGCTQEADKRNNWEDLRDRFEPGWRGDSNGSGSSFASQYHVVNGSTVRMVQSKSGPIEEVLSNFHARISEEITLDDGIERKHIFKLTGTLCNGRQLPEIEISASEFAAMRWVSEQWGAGAIVGAKCGEHLRAAIQTFSKDVKCRTVYGHTGWHKGGDNFVYLHSRGGIDKNGSRTDIEVNLSSGLDSYRLPDPPEGEDLISAVRASMDLLGLTSANITAPVLGAVYRAPLGQADFGVHLAGQTGSFKTEIAALAQQHYGAEMHAKNLPGSWSSTGNALEAQASALKDALFVVDDFAPSGTPQDIQRYHRDAERLFRAQGNRAGRARMSMDGKIRQGRKPRGVILSTGEEIPRGESIRARVLIVEVEPGSIESEALTKCQKDAASGAYAQAMAGFIKWFAGKYETVQSNIRSEIDTLRAEAAFKAKHKRTPEIVANLGLGLKYLFQFAAEIGAFEAGEQADLWDMAWEGLCDSANAQAAHQNAEDPVLMYIDFLGSAFSTGMAHLTNTNHGLPLNAELWGWKSTAFNDFWTQQGVRIGWLDGANGEDIYLDPIAAYNTVQEVARRRGSCLPISDITLRRRLKERGFVVSTESADSCTNRKTLGGARRQVLHLRANDVMKGEPIA